MGDVRVGRAIFGKCPADGLDDAPALMDQQRDEREAGHTARVGDTPQVDGGQDADPGPPVPVSVGAPGAPLAVRKEELVVRRSATGKPPLVQVPASGLEGWRWALAGLRVAHLANETAASTRSVRLRTTVTCEIQVRTLMEDVCRSLGRGRTCPQLPETDGLLSSHEQLKGLSARRQCRSPSRLDLSDSRNAGRRLGGHCRPARRRRGCASQWPWSIGCSPNQPRWWPTRCHVAPIALSKVTTDVYAATRLS